MLTAGSTAFDSTLLSFNERLMKHFLLFYDFCEDYLQRRPALRDSHLRKAWDASRAGRTGHGRRAR